MIFYKNIQVSFETNYFSLINQEKSNIISSENLPDFFNSDFDIYSFFQENCNNFVSSFLRSDFVMANISTKNLGSFFQDNLDFFKQNQVDFGIIIDIFINTKFLNALYDTVNSKSEYVVPNSSYLIAALSCVSDVFIDLLLQKDFLIPLVEFLLEEYILTNDQIESIFVAINNLMTLYYKIDPEYKIITYNFSPITNIFMRCIHISKVAKLVYLLVRFSQNTFCFYPMIISFFDINYSKSIYQFILYSLYYMLDKEPRVLSFIMERGIIPKLFESYYEFSSDLHVNQPDLKDINNIKTSINGSNNTKPNYTYAYTKMITKALSCFDFGQQEEMEKRKDYIVRILNLSEIMHMITSSENKENLCAIQFIHALIKNQLLFKVIDDPKKLFNDILSIFEDSATSIKLESLSLLGDLFIYIKNCNFIEDKDSFLNTIVCSVDNESLVDFIETDNSEIQEIALNFIHLVISNLSNNFHDEPPQYVINILDDKTLMDSIERAAKFQDKNICFIAKKILLTLNRFWDIPYNSSNCHNDNYIE